MIINFSRQNEIRIDSVCKWLKKNISSESFTRGQLRDFVVDSILTQLSQSDIQKIIINSVKKV